MDKMLVSLIDGEQPGSLILPARLVVRESSKPPALLTASS
jgi:DNA-binding LacI/PurR family transcriptional regulator